MKRLIKDIQQPQDSRQADYNLLEVFNEFELKGYDSLIEGTYGNIQSDFFEYDLKTRKYKSKLGVKYQDSFSNLVSAPMLLARLISAGCSPIVEGQQGYKTTFIFTLKHKETGAVVTFYDWKGAPSFGACELGHRNKEFKKSLKKLLKALIDPKFPHPYDSCVVGEIA